MSALLGTGLVSGSRSQDRASVALDVLLRSEVQDAEPLIHTTTG